METVEIKNRLAEAMSLRGMKQSELAERTKIPKASISQYLSGYAEPKTDRLFMMAGALEVNVTWLMGLDTPMEPDARPLSERYSEENGLLLLKIKSNPSLMKMCKEFMLLDSTQQQSVVNLVHSMIPHKQP